MPTAGETEASTRPQAGAHFAPAKAMEGGAGIGTRRKPEGGELSARRKPERAYPVLRRLARAQQRAWVWPTGMPTKPGTQAAPARPMRGAVLGGWRAAVPPCAAFGFGEMGYFGD